MGRYCSEALSWLAAPAVQLFENADCCGHTANDSNIRRNSSTTPTIQPKAQWQNKKNLGCKQRPGVSWFPLIVVVLFSLDSCRALSKNNIKTIQVCQNKHCCKHYQGQSANLVQTIQDLTHTHDENDYIKVESTGCLSECQQGPNLQIGDQKISGVSNPGIAAAHLVALDRPTPKLLLAAVQVLEKAHGTYIHTCYGVLNISFLWVALSTGHIF
jgi:hypothetical protein